MVDKRSTFAKLSLTAQYDDVCRVVRTIIKDTEEEEQYFISLLENLEKRWIKKEQAFQVEKDDLKTEISSLQREIKKLNRQLAESRTALGREVEEKKAVAREKKTLLDQIKQVRQLVESKDGSSDDDAHRRRMIRCLETERLSPIQSDDSDDCVSGLDYDKTEEDILDGERSRRSAAFEEALDHFPSNEQPTLVGRFSDKGSESDDIPDEIEKIRQQMKEFENEKKETLTTMNSTPTIHNLKKASTLSAKSAANMKRTISNINTPVANTLKPHSFVSKKSFRPESCVPCGVKISFYGDVCKCEVCSIVCHPQCKDACPLPCVKITAPTRSRQKKILISDYVNSDSIPKVPALIVHCCNEIEREGNIETPGLYRVIALTQEVEDLQQKILKSKSGMPNLSNYDVHLLTGVVKRFLQSLDESLITTTLWTHAAEAVKLESSVETSTHLGYFIGFDLPPANRETLSFLMQHLHKIAKHSDKNHMTTNNLAKVLAPTVVGNSCRNPKQNIISNETKIQIQIMEALFDIEEEFWAKYVPKIEPTPTAPSLLGSRLLGTPTSSSRRRTRSSTRNAGTLPTPKIKSLFS